MSAYFSASETAFLSLRLSRIRELKKKKVHNAELIEKLKEDSYQTIIALLIGNNLVNILASALATSITFEIMASYQMDGAIAIAVATGVMTFLVLIFGEITPKTFAVSRAEKFMLLTVRLLYLVKLILLPLVYLFEGISGIMLKLLGAQKTNAVHSEGELRAFVEMSEEEGVIKAMEKKLIHNILDFDDTSVKEIMTPISDVIALDYRAGINDVLNIIVDSNFSRILIYKDHVEEIIGVVHIKDVLPHIKKGDFKVRLDQVMRKVSFIPAAKKISALLRYFQNHKEHIAVIVNEYGNTLGVVTLEDVLEEIVGEINDESDDETDMEEDIQIIDKTTLVVSGTTLVDDITDKLQITIEHRGAYETIAGYITHHTGRIPKTGSTLKIGNLHITILASDHRRIDRIKLKYELPEVAQVLR